MASKKKISFTYVTDREVKDIGEKLYRPPVSKYQRYRYTHIHWRTEYFFMYTVPVLENRITGTMLIKKSILVKFNLNFLTL